MGQCSEGCSLGVQSEDKREKQHGATFPIVISVLPKSFLTHTHTHAPPLNAICSLFLSIRAQVRCHVLFERLLLNVLVHILLSIFCSVCLV